MAKYNSRAFTTQIELVNKKWFGDFLGLEPQNHGGIDLLGDGTGIELKCRYDKNSPTFTIHDY